MSTTVLDRSLQQRRDAIARANLIRSVRAELKRNVRLGNASVLAVLADPAPEYLTMKVRTLLMALPKWGSVKATQIMNGCRISDAKTIGGLSDRQRDELVRHLTSRGIA